MDADILVPLAVFATIAAISISSFYYGFKKRSLVFEAIKTAIEKNGTVDPQLVDAILQDNIGPYADLRKGIILLAVAGAFALLGYSIPEEDAIGPMLGVASFPGLIGLAYVAFHFFAPREPTV